jgi:hypothetical protein
MAAAAQLDSVGESAWTSSCVSTALAADLKPTAATATAVPQVLSPEHRAARELCALCCCNAAVAAFKLRRYSDCTAAASRAITKSTGTSVVRDGLAGDSGTGGASIVKPLYWRARAKVSGNRLYITHLICIAVACAAKFSNSLECRSMC